MTEYIKDGQVVARSYQSGRGGWTFEKGAKVESQPAGWCAGYIMPCFMVREMRHCDTEKELRRCIRALGTVTAKVVQE
ncbi:MAG: hypothetical protein RR998_08500 [Oscillospiraceae bacterium]